MQRLVKQSRELVLQSCRNRCLVG